MLDDIGSQSPYVRAFADPCVPPKESQRGVKPALARLTAACIADAAEIARGAPLTSRQAAWPSRAGMPVAYLHGEVAMDRNEGTVDRAVRIALGLGLLALTVVGPSSLFGLLGLIPLATGLLGTCPIYRPFGVTTCRTR